MAVCLLDVNIFLFTGGWWYYCAVLATAVSFKSLSFKILWSLEILFKVSSFGGIA